MKKLSSLISLSAIVLLAGGCAKEIASPEAPVQSKGLWAVFEQPVNGLAETKALGSDYKFFWKDSEKINVFGATDGEQLTYKMEASSTSAGKFHTSNFKLIEDQTYYASYPALGDVDDLTSVPVSFEGQVQSANDNTDHLAKYAYSTAGATVSGNSATFNFSTKVAWFKFDFTFLADETVTSIELKAGSAVIPTSAKLDVKTGSLVADAKADHITLALGEDGIAPVGDKLVAHLTVLPFEYEGELTVSVSCKSGNVYTTTIPSLTLEANKYYTTARVIASAKPVLNADKYYEVYTTDHWNWVANTSHKNGALGIKLMRDLEFNGADVSDICNASGVKRSFSIDGNGHKMTKLVVKRNSLETDNAYGGLVRIAEDDITIKNLVIDTVKVDVPLDDPDDVHSFAGALIGSVDGDANVTIADVTVKHADVKGVQSVGGLVGFLASGATLTVNNCTVGDSHIHNYSVEGESGCVHGMVGRVVGKLAFEGSNKIEKTSVEGYWCPKRGETSIGKVAGASAKDSTPDITGLNTVDASNEVTVTKTIVVPAKPSLVDGKWEIYTVEHWNYVAGVKQYTQGIKLMADLDFDGATIGGIILDGADFDGNNHEISNFDIKVPNGDYSHGLIRGELGTGNITVSNLKIKTAKVGSHTGDGWAGILCGDIQNERTVTLNNVSIDGADVKGIQSLGVLVGFVGSGSVLNVNGCSVSNVEVSNDCVEGESGYVCGVVGKVAGTVNFGEGNTLSKAEIWGNYAGAKSGRPITTIDPVAAIRGAGVITGADKVTLSDVKVWPALSTGSLLIIDENVGADMTEASLYINASSKTVFDIKFQENNTWDTGNAGAGSNNIFTKEGVTVNIDLDGNTLTMTGEGGFRSSAKINFKNGTVVDNTSYGYENGETAWEFTYLELEGAEMTFDNVVFNNSMMTKSANAVFTNCEFKGISTLASNRSEEYAVWVNHGKASFTNCKIGNGYRGLKICDMYTGENVSSLIIDGCTFENLGKKPGIAIDSKNNASIVIKNSKFNDVQLGDQSLFIYETDNVKPVLTDNIIGISKAATLKAVATAVNEKHQKFIGLTLNLIGDIDLNNDDWTPIGLRMDNSDRFAGTFDGKGHTISNLKVNQTAGGNSAGLFGGIDGGATIRNFTIDGAEIESVVTPSVDGIAVAVGAAAYGGYIDGITVKNATVKGNHYVAGIVGYTGGDVTNCRVENITITNTPNEVSPGVYNNGDKAGGIIGHTNSKKYNTGNITGNVAKNVSITAYRDLGGIIGSSYLNTYNVKNNTVEGYLKLTVDQTKFYEAKDGNYGNIVGRDNNGGSPDASNICTAAVTVIQNLHE